nr:unnamed protein product [Callosobruchus analis]CAI5832160.1 unnamed protein product [Callosobruchus analis]
MCIKLCEAFQLALRAHDETSTSNNPGIYIGLLNFTAEIDTLLAIYIHERFASVQRYIKNYLERSIRSSPSPPQILTTKLLSLFPQRKQGEWILCTKNRDNFFCAHPHSNPRSRHCYFQG